MIRLRDTVFGVTVLVTAMMAAAWPRTAEAQGQAAPQNSASAAAQADPADDPDMNINLSQPDFTLIGLPTTLRMPKFKSSFRVTHRFRGNLGDYDDLGDAAGDLFGIDQGAQIGLEYRFGLMSGLQVGFRRTSDKTIDFFTQYNVLQQSKHGVGLGATASIEGTNNFKDSYTPSLGLVLSRELGEHGAVYVSPMWVNNSNPLPSQLADDNDTFFVGLGARVRVRPTVYLVAEAIPRVGHTPGTTYGSFGIEKRAGGHTFQLNFSNGFGTTTGQLARGGTGSKDWYLGFNISRKFF